MKRYYALFVFAVMGMALIATPGFADVGINSSTFPDEAFRNYISSVFDQDGDGIITDDEIANITVIEPVGLGVKNVKGIEYFTALQYLTCSGNELTEIDLSGNPEFIGLACENNQITSLNLTQNPKLYQLWFNDNLVTEIDLSHNPELTILECKNNRLTSLNISANTKLRELAFSN